MTKKVKNFPRLVWITSLFLELIVILLMIMDYKINYQYLTKNYLYFYECNGNLCVSQVKDNSHLLLSKYSCDYDTCPIYKSNVEDEYAILETASNAILYDYRKGKIISEDYNSYQFFNSSYIIVESNNYQGIIDLSGNTVVSLKYQELGVKQEDYLAGYSLNWILCKKNDKYGIINYRTGEIVEECTHLEEEVDTLLEKIKQEQ